MSSVLLAVNLRLCLFMEISDPFKTDPVNNGTTSRTATELEELATETPCTPQCDIFVDPAAWPQVVITSEWQL